ncbi:MAG: hypothetical protein EZS28_003670 [Streblomastix strix]|uniref:Integrase catalytic domain-containing protein n=1 Tax=Streblomastix strix TaxID=222440 RepID=A0A5J4X0C2_9EUKA|nr:MAG: hypothetical protein EZS28_003670 [Streblomastix strix]
MDRCDAKLDARIAGGLPCKTNKNKPDLDGFDEAHKDTVYDMRMSLKNRIQDEIHWMNSECSVENKLHNALKPLNKLQRQYFSPKLGSWEIDLVFGVNPVTRRRQHYLFAININTKYLVVIPIIVDEKNATYILAALKKFINQVYVNNIRGDGETGFKANIIRQFYEDNKISLYFTGSPYTQHNRVVDSVIRTIRNGFGQELIGLATPSQMQQMVEIYNKTPHLAFMNRHNQMRRKQNKEVDLKNIAHKKKPNALPQSNDPVPKKNIKYSDRNSEHLLMICNYF